MTQQIEQIIIAKEQLLDKQKRRIFGGRTPHEINLQ